MSLEFIVKLNDRVQTQNIDEEACFCTAEELCRVSIRFAFGHQIRGVCQNNGKAFDLVFVWRAHSQKSSVLSPLLF